MVLDISQYEVKEDKSPNESIESTPQLPEVSTSSISSNQSIDASTPIDISQYQVKEEPSAWDNAIRNATRWGSRLVEQIAGGTADLINTGQMLLSGNNTIDLSKFGIPKFPEEERPEWDKKISGAIKESLQPKRQIPQMQGLPNLNTSGSIPTTGSADLEAASKTLSEGYLAPQGDWEEKSDEVVKNFARAFMGRLLPGPRIPGPPPRFAALRKFGQDLGSAVAAEAAKEGVKLLGGSQESQEKAKYATLFTTGLMLQSVSGRTADNYVNGLYQQRDRLIHQGSIFNTTNLENNLTGFINNRLRFGGPTPEKDAVLRVTEEFLNRINNRQGQMSVQELLQMARDVNRNSASVYLQPLDRAGVRAARGYYGELNGIFNNVVEGQLATINPQALGLHRAAQSGWGAIQQSGRVREAIKRGVKGIPFKTGVASILGGALVSPAGAVKLASGAAVGSAILSTGEALTRIYLSPTMRHYYSQVIRNSLRENTPAMLQALKKLDDAYYKEVVSTTPRKSNK